MRLLLLVPCLCALLASCGGLQPEGTLKKVVEGQMFEPANAAAVKQDEDGQRESLRTLPRNPADDEPVTLRFKL